MDQALKDEVNSAIGNFWDHLQTNEEPDIHKLGELLGEIVSPIFKHKAMMLDRTFDSDTRYLRAVFFALREIYTEDLSVWQAAMHDGFIQTFQEIYDI